MKNKDSFLKLLNDLDNIRDMTFYSPNEIRLAYFTAQRIRNLIKNTVTVELTSLTEATVTMPRESLKELMFISIGIEDKVDSANDIFDFVFREEGLVKDFVEGKTNIVRKAYVVSILDNERSQDACKIPMWLYSNWEAARKKAREYTEGKHDNPFKWAIVNDVDVMDE